MGSKLFCAFLIAGRAMAQAPASDAPKYPPGLYALITTSVGVITAQLFEKETPVTVRVFIGLARGTQQWLDPKTRKPATHPLYENLIFHRVIPDFMIQTGDPTATGAHDCGFRLPDEFVDALKFDRPGRLAMANAGPGTAACQFFITEDKYAAGNGHYAIFGQVVNGQPLVGKISHVLRDDHDRPKIPTTLIKITFMRVVPDATTDK
ncbi:MAG TPA: peptidylprolyl isomerase [Bryobacteraceae bacterium]|jgi:peptidyl-prolyl cis-trans isomerase A (cyclophilin A)|nr:peptidylprolyl isomerase [Bryobacteraceae bacterium]